MLDLQKTKAVLTSPWDVIEISLFDSALVKFIGCFTQAHGRHLLLVDQVYKGCIYEKSEFKYFDSMRNKHVVHDENNFYTVNLLVYLDASDQAVRLNGLMARLVPQVEVVSRLRHLVQVAKKYCDDQIKKVTARLLDEVRALSVEERKAMPSYSHVVGPFDVSAPRKR
jgi:hypothetical protein